MPIFSSSTQEVPKSSEVPRHIAIIMDGNGRWARARMLPRVAGHRKGRDALREIVKASVDRGVAYLTVFAFSSENWRRPQEEVSVLMQLFMRALEQEVIKLHKNNVRFRVIGDLSRFDAKIVDLIKRGETLTENNTNLTFTVAANYGGRWDIMQAMQKMAADGHTSLSNFSESDLTQHLSLNYAPEPDLFIRTGGEKRISNFLLWQLAYTELYFVDTLWPDFNVQALDLAIASYQQRERRFGRTSEQLKTSS